MSTWYTCIQCGVLFRTCQILEKVSPNRAEAKAVVAQRNHKKNRSMKFPPGIPTATCTTFFHMAVCTVPSGQVACGTEGREPRLHLCLCCACKYSLWV